MHHSKRLLLFGLVIIGLGLLGVIGMHSFIGNAPEAIAKSSDEDTPTKGRPSKAGSDSNPLPAHSDHHPEQAQRPDPREGLSALFPDRTAGMSNSDLESLALEIIALAREKGLRSQEILSFVTHSVSDEHPRLAMILYQQLEPAGGASFHSLIRRTAKKDLELAVELTFYFANGSNFERATYALFESLDAANPEAASQIEAILEHYTDQDDIITADKSLAHWIMRSADRLDPLILQQICLDSDQFGPATRFRALNAMWQQAEASPESAIRLISSNPDSIPPNFVQDVTSHLIKANTPISEIVEMGKHLESGEAKEEMVSALLASGELLETNLAEISQFIAGETTGRRAYTMFASHLLDMPEESQSTALSHFSNEKQDQLLVSMFNIALRNSRPQDAERLAQQVTDPGIQKSLLSQFPPNQNK